MFGVSAAELGNHKPADWSLWPGLAYVFSVVLAMADSFYCSLICVLVVAAAQRARIWDMRGDTYPRDVEVIATLSMQSPEDVIRKWEMGDPYHVQIARAMTNGAHTPCLGLSFVPASCYLSMVAGTYRGMKDAAVITQILVIVIVTVPGLMALFFARRLMNVIL